MIRIIPNNKGNPSKEVHSDKGLGANSFSSSRVAEAVEVSNSRVVVEAEDSNFQEVLAFELGRIERLHRWESQALEQSWEVCCLGRIVYVFCSIESNEVPLFPELISPSRQNNDVLSLFNDYGY